METGLQHSFLTETEITKQFHNLLRECILSSYSNWTGKTIWKYADRLAVVGGKSDLYIKNCLEDCFGHYESGPQILSNFLWHLSFLFFLFIRYLTIPRHITIFWCIHQVQWIAQIDKCCITRISVFSDPVKRLFKTIIPLIKHDASTVQKTNVNMPWLRSQSYSISIESWMKTNLQVVAKCLRRKRNQDSIAKLWAMTIRKGWWYQRMSAIFVLVCFQSWQYQWKDRLFGGIPLRAWYRWFPVQYHRRLFFAHSTSVEKAKRIFEVVKIDTTYKIGPHDTDRSECKDTSTETVSTIKSWVSGTQEAAERIDQKRMDQVIKITLRSIKSNMPYVNIVGIDVISGTQLNTSAVANACISVIRKLDHIVGQQITYEHRLRWRKSTWDYHDRFHCCYSGRIQGCFSSSAATAVHVHAQNKSKKCRRNLTGKSNIRH